MVIACPHPIGEYVFYDISHHKGAIDKVKTYADSFMPWIMCQFPTVQEPEYFKLYNTVQDRQCKDIITKCTFELVERESIRVSTSYVAGIASWCDV